jgi:hypothetical protein
MLKATRFAIQVIHPRVGRYLKRQEKRIQRKFWDALDQICEGPFHCSYRYALSKGKRGLRIKYDVDVEPARSPYTTLAHGGTRTRRDLPLFCSGS